LVTKFVSKCSTGFTPKVDPRHCEALGKPGCNARNQYFTGDYIGVTERYLKKKYGSTLCFLNGPVLGINPLRSKVWEVSEEFPIRGDGDEFPNGAVALDGNFRKQFIIGRELGIQIERTIRNSEVVRPVEFGFKSQEFFSRNTNIRFRLVMAIWSPATNRSIAGYRPRDCYICSDPKNPTPETCKSDEYSNTINYDFPLPLRKGEWVKSTIKLVDFGPNMKWITGPAEVTPELFIGLPADFGVKYYENPQFHAVGENYTMPGFVMQHMKCKHCWFVGLGGDELGYMLPISDYRVKCSFTKAECDRLGMTYFDSMSGTECKWVIENPEEAKVKYGNRYAGILFTCRYGLLDQARSHYEEVNGLGWDLAKDYIDAVKKIFQNKN
jgi:hypothetical protein